MALATTIGDSEEESHLSASSGKLTLKEQVVFPNFREDWRTYGGDIFRPGLWVMAVYRFGRWRYGIRLRFLRMPFSFAYKLLAVAVTMMSGVELPCETRIGRRLRIEHQGGIVISGDVCLGDDVILRNGVTIGLRRTGMRGSPKIGNRVDIGAGAKILGEITIGDDVSIGANAVVLCNVPSNSIAVGVPARVMPTRRDSRFGALESYAGNPTDKR
jgi:serine O-acetyltransferase